MRSSQAFLALILAAFFIALARTAILAPPDGTDFQVYWNAAQHFWHGEKVYSFTRDALRCFKYPPWILPWFLPLGAFSLSSGAVLFRLLSVGAIVLLWRKLRQATSEWASVALLIFWGFWMYNTQTGQISAFLLLAAWIGFEKNTPLLATALSAKIVQLYSLLGVDFKKVLRAVPLTAVICALFCIPSLLPYGTHLGEWFHDFREASVSVGPDLAASNQGIAAFWIAIFGLPVNEIKSHYLAAGFSAVLLAVLFSARRKNIDPRERFALMLAYGGILHPLAFSYNFVWAYPLVTFSLDRAFRKRDWRVCASVVVILAEFALVSEKTVGWLVFPGYRAIMVVLLGVLLEFGYFRKASGANVR